MEKRVVFRYGSIDLTTIHNDNLWATNVKKASMGHFTFMKTKNGVKTDTSTESESMEKSEICIYILQNSLYMHIIHKICVTSKS